MKKIFLSLGLPLLVLANEFNTGIENEISWLKEETYVVSASRVKENIDKSAASITVIDEDMIRKMGADTILDILRVVPGIGVTQSNIFTNEIESRGIKDWFSKQILFMIDGHSTDTNLLNGGSTWTLDKLHVKNIKRVEIVKGPASALYGANAFTALVNIITKKANDIDGVEVSAKLGSYKTEEANLLFGQKYDKLSVVANINVFESDGNKVFVKQDAVNNSGYTNPYRKQFVANLALEYEEFYLSSMYSSREDGQYFGPIGTITDKSNPKIDYLFVEAGYKNDISKNLNINLKVYYDKYEADNRWGIYADGYPVANYIDGMTIINGYTNDKYGTEGIITYKFNENYTLLVGAMFEQQNQYDVINKQNFALDGTALSEIRDFSDEASTFAPKVDRNMYALYMNNLYDITSYIHLTFGLRYDSYSDLGSNLAPRGGLSWEIDKKNRIKLLYGEGFRVATFAELYNINSPVINGNSNLNPEKVRTYEMSYETNPLEGFDLKLTYFYNDFSDLIVQVANNYVNRGETVTQGLEFETKYNLNRGSYILANYTYLKAEDKISNEDLPDLAKHKGNIIFNYRINRYINSFNHIFLKGKTNRAVGDTRDDVNGYALFNTSFIVNNFYENLELKFVVNNLFDKKNYHPSRVGLLNDDYEQPGRNVMAELSYRF